MFKKKKGGGGGGGEEKLKPMDTIGHNLVSNDLRTQDTNCLNI